jgi:hypothetical protein
LFSAKDGADAFGFSNELIADLTSATVDVWLCSFSADNGWTESVSLLWVSSGAFTDGGGVRSDDDFGADF